MEEGNGNPLQYSCLENPRDGGDWWAAVYGVAQSWTRLNDLAVAVVNNPPANAGYMRSIPGSRRSLKEGSDNSFQDSCLENPINRGSWRDIVLGVEKE